MTSADCKSVALWATGFESLATHHTETHSEPNLGGDHKEKSMFPYGKSRVTNRCSLSTGRRDSLVSNTDTIFKHIRVSVFEYGRAVNKGKISMTSLTYLKNKKFIGDLSLQDADVISEYASKSKSILEFGVGGSTQLLAQSNADLIISVETSTDWIELTKKRLNQIDNTRPVQIMDYTTKFDTKFDLIFVDGVDNLRRQFAIETWQYLNTDGVMLFHDTRRLQDFQNAVSVAEQYFLEISKISVNVNASDGVSSNITVLHKKQHVPYINWNLSEGKPLWAYALQYNEDMWSYNG